MSRIRPGQYVRNGREAERSDGFLLGTHRGDRAEVTQVTGNRGRRLVHFDLLSAKSSEAIDGLEASEERFQRLFRRGLFGH